MLGKHPSMNSNILVYLFFLDWGGGLVSSVERRWAAYGWVKGLIPITGFDTQGFMLDKCLSCAIGARHLIAI